METIEGLDKLIRTRLIEKRGNVKLAENKDIVLYGKELGITENQLLFKILDISETIDWSEVEKNNTQENYNFQTTNNDNTDIQQPVTNSIQCSNCNAINEKGIANYCVECGAELKIQPEPKTISEPTPDSNQNNYSTTQEKTKSKTPIIIGLLGIIIALIAGYFLWGKEYLKDQNATRMYSFANSLALRSSPAGGGDYNMIANIPYGSEVLVYDNGIDWVNCKVNGQEGYASPKYMLDNRDFQELNAILADVSTRTVVSQTRYKKALLSYFRDHNLIGKMDEKIQQDLYSLISTKEVWQLFANAEVNQPNTVYFSTKSKQNSKFNDFACIIKNLNTGERKILIFSFDENENPKFEGEDIAPNDGYISHIYYDYASNGYMELTPMYTN
jgi:hypothetical protein